MTLKKNIIFTFDYEPFLGSKSGTLNNCIIEPTERLKLILNTYNAKAVFFIDTLYLKNLKLVSINEYGIIIKQIQQ